jgi:hypothetical protein
LTISINSPNNVLRSISLDWICGKKYAEIHRGIDTLSEEDANQEVQGV